MRFILVLLGILFSMMALGSFTTQYGKRGGLLFAGIAFLSLYSAYKRGKTASAQKRGKNGKKIGHIKTDLWCIGGKIRNKQVNEYIKDNIKDDEEVIATLLGLGEKTGIGALFGKDAGAALGGDYLLVTDKKVVVLKKGVGTWATGAFGIKAKTFLYDHITSVDVSSGIMVGEIEVVAAGMVEKGSGGFFSGAEKDAVVQFDKKYFKEVQKLVTRIREIAQEHSQARVFVGTASNIPEQIKTLAELKERGLISEEEFNDKKYKLLRKI